MGANHALMDTCKPLLELGTEIVAITPSCPQSRKKLLVEARVITRAAVAPIPV